MSDRIAVMSRGRIAQMGSPREVCQEPRSEYVADFLGVANLLDVQSRPGSAGRGTVTLGDFELQAVVPQARTGAGRAVIRPERVRLSRRGHTDQDRTNSIPGMVERSVFLGPTSQVLVRLADGSRVHALLTNESDSEHFCSGESASVALDADSLRVLVSDSDGGHAQDAPDDESGRR
jgi:spermidine/putrescine transport system ATP-binding protein